MYSTTSKPQEDSTCKDSLPKCFIATNYTAKLSRGAVNRGEVLFLYLNFYMHFDPTIYSAEISIKIFYQNIPPDMF